MLSRRKFIQYTLVGTSVASVGYISQTSGAGTFEKAVAKLLTDDLKGLRVNKSDIQEFSKNLAQYRFERFHFVGVQLICLYHLNPFKSLPLPFPRKYRELRTGMVGSFLLSTNFFYNKMDEAKDITYSGLEYDPYKNVCGNPFSGAAL